MRHTSLLLSALGLAACVQAQAETVYSGEFDYRQFQPSAAYFSGHTDSEITRFCKTGEKASGDDLAQCAHREFERVSARLDSKESAAKRSIALNDKALNENSQEPLAMPYFVNSSAAWVQYRDNQCYAETYMLGEASERYTRFWHCMASITKIRVEELESFLKN
jgi:uncharacterized protein YecT (DUF1311 family)